MWRSIASNFLTLLIIALIALAGVIAWGQRSWVSPGPLAQTVCVSVPRGANLTTVSQRFEAQGVISDAQIFRLGAEYLGRDQALKAGNFLVPAGASMQQVTYLVTDTGQSTCGAEANYRISVTGAEIQLRDIDPATGRFEVVAEFPPVQQPPEAYRQFLENGFGTYRVTVAEGATSYHIWDSLAKLPALDGEVQDIPAEGSLAPGSYDIAPGDSRSEILAEMAERQEDILAKAWAERAPGLPLDSAEEALILASIIEKETGVAGERPQVASVFVNRLRLGMRLQTDPTVIYGLTEGKRPLGRGLRVGELRRATPYNTYVISGLP
ncbi:MAG: endolytic transglycosylase MltG, partial [Mangrovicoccus sp.]